MTEKNVKLPNLGARHPVVAASPRNAVLDAVEGHIAEAKAIHADGAHQKPSPVVKRSSQVNLLVQRKISQGQDPRGGAKKFAALGRKVVTALSWKRVLSKPAASALPEEPKKEPELDLPAQPRFCATLSVEAQYAMMKGYEDLLLTNLKESYPDRAVFLPRTRTPPIATKKIVDTDSDDSESEKNAAANLKPLVPVSNDNKQVGPVTKTKPKHKGPKKKQLVITYRFQSAMDILDTMRDKKGHLVTSPRLKEKTINPVDSYSSWKTTWSKEFKFKPVPLTK